MTKRIAAIAATLALSTLAVAAPASAGADFRTSHRITTHGADFQKGCSDVWC